jgi:hypothetical protein
VIITSTLETITRVFRWRHESIEEARIDQFLALMGASAAVSDIILMSVEKPVLTYDI